MKNGKADRKGILIYQENQVSGNQVLENQEPKNQEKRMFLALQAIWFLAVLFVMTAFCESFLSVFVLPVTRRYLYGYLLMAVLINLALCLPGKKKWAYYIAEVCLYVLLVYCKRDIIGETANRIMNSFIELYNLRMDMQLLLWEETYIAEKDLAFSIVVLLMFFTFILCRIVSTGRKKIIAVIIMTFPIIASAIVGHIPSGTSCWMILLSGGIFSAVSRRKGNVRAGINGICAGVFLLVIIITAMNLQPLVLQKRESSMAGYLNVRAGLLHNITKGLKRLAGKLYWDGNYASGGVGKGNLKDLASNQSFGTKDLEVVLDYEPLETVYLKAYAGDTYTGEAWDLTSEKEFRKLVADWHVSSPEMEAFNMPFDIVGGIANPPEVCRADIEVLQGNDEFSYVPYFPQVEKDYKVVGDAYIKGEKDGKSSFPHYPMAEAMKLSNSELGQASDRWLEYSNFVNKVYTRFPDNLVRLKGLAGGNDYSNVEEVTEYIQFVLGQMATYDLQPGKKPEDKDFAEYFLFDNGKGFCVHFATTAVLLYRMNGVPARYVSGYAIPASEFTEQKNGTYKATATDGMAHAWSEIFDSKRGWVAREHTPGYTDSDNVITTQNKVAGDTNEQQEEGIKDTKNTKDVELAETPKSAADKAADELEQKPKKPITIDKVLQCMAAVLMVMLILLLQAWVRTQKKYLSILVRKTSSKDSGHRWKSQTEIQNIYSNIYDICVFMGMEKMEPLCTKTLEHMIKLFPHRTEEEWRWLYRCVLKSMFSEAEPSVEEVQKMLRFYKTFAGEIMKTLSFGKKVMFRYVYCLG